MILGNRDPLEILRELDGYYECPKGPGGERLGPLVGYAGRYDGPDGQKLQFVGDVYANFAKAERRGEVLGHFARILWGHPRLPGNNFCGAPEGGKALAVALATISGGQYIFPEKKITTLVTETSREVSKLVFGRHEPAPGEKWWLVEDVCNNFSTTKALVALVESFGAEVVGVVCFLNRSLSVDDEFEIAPGRKIPVVAIVRKPIDEWRQDDSAVADDVARGNVAWKPKADWERLKTAMRNAGALSGGI